MQRTSLVLLALWIVTAPSPAIAQDEPQAQVADPATAPWAAEQEMAEGSALQSDGDRMRLRLADAVALGIENNLGLQVERFDPLIESYSRTSAWGAYDPNANASYLYRDTTNPVTGNVLQGNSRTTSKNHDTNFGLDTLVPYLGATVGLDFDMDRTSDVNPLTTQRPIWQTGITLSGNLPLLKGLIWNEPWTRVKTSQAAYEGATENFRSDLMDVVQFIETSYWDLVAQTQAVRVAEKSLETARSLLDQTETQYEVGVKSKVEVVEAEAGVAAREFDLIRAVNRYRRAQDDLIDAVLGTQLGAGSKLEVEPADDPEDYVEYHIDTVEAAEKALSNRPELAEAEKAIERSEFQLKFAKNQRLPQLDVQASYGVVGRAGRGRTTSGIFTGGTTSTGADTGALNDTFDDWGTTRGGDTVTAGATFSIPIGNISGRNDVSRSRLELRKAKTRLVRLRQDIILEVRDGARNLESAQEGIEAAERRRLAAEEQLRAEKVRLEYGESTPFKVLEKEEDLVEAENAKIGALFTYRRSVVDLHRAQGTILETRNIVVDEAASLR